MTCKAFQAAGSMVCKACDLEWDAGNQDAPKCRQAHECAVCAGQSDAVHVGRFALCGDPQCYQVAKHWLDREPDGRSYWEREATTTAGREAGRYLERIGKYDLSQLSPDQYGQFVETVVKTYRRELRRLAAHSAPPF